MKYLQIDEFMRYKFLSNLRLSPGGHKQAVLVSAANENNSYSKAIYVNKGEGFFALTSPKGSVGTYTWHDDGSILFSEVRCKKIKERVENGEQITSFHWISTDGGEAVTAFDIEAAVLEVEPLSNGNFLLLVLHDEGRIETSALSATEAAEALKKERQYQVVDELPFWYNERGFINKKRRRLYEYNMEDGSFIPLTPALFDVTGYRLSPCKGYILLTGTREDVAIRDSRVNLYMLERGSANLRPLLKQEMFVHSFGFHGDKIALAAASGEKYNFHEHPSFYTMEKDGSGIKKLRDYDLSLGFSVTTDSKFSGGILDKVHDGKLFFVSLDGYEADVYSICLDTGVLANETNCGGSIGFFDIGKNGLYYCAMKGLGLQEIYSKEGPTSSFNNKVLEGVSLSQPEHYAFTDSEGYEIDGWVMKPLGYDEGKTYPGILNIHGGPKAAFGDSFFHEMQYWAGQGYFVLFCNPRGSDGKGNDFADIRGKYGSVDYDNIMQFVDEMCARYPSLDSGRLGVTGGSYGGFMTNWIIGHTQRFKAAVTQRSICNWVSFGYVSDIGYFFGKDQMQADPWSDIDKMWHHSPLKYAPNVKTPTLILHSDEDYRCWIPEAYQWFHALKLHGVETRLHIFRGENHELSRSGRPEQRARRIREITAWMDKFLK